MIPQINKINRKSSKHDSFIVVNDIKKLQIDLLSDDELLYVASENKKNKTNFFPFNKDGKWIIISLIKIEKNREKYLENLRLMGSEIQDFANKKKVKEIFILDADNIADDFKYVIEGLILGNYVFDKYLSKKKDKIEGVFFYSKGLEEIEEMLNILKGTIIARDLVNEPLNHLNALQLAEKVEEYAKEAGYKAEVFHKKKIESLKMGGLLAVNKGSIDPPTFSIMEWKPKNAINTKPYVFVGKGVVYDTGGLNIKTGTYMDDMKSDMGGAAAVIGAMYSIAANNLDIWVIGLVPATDNRLDGNAYVSGDIISMHNGKTVEVLNTDAEGRMILADALSYAQKYDPLLVIDIATLTGAAQRAVGKYATIAMETKAKKYLSNLEKSSFEVWERIVSMPFWDDYAELIKSDIADIKNIGGAEAGAITAGKFLEHFTNYPYIHLDIAGSAFMDSNWEYRKKGGTGVGVRLFYNFMKNISVINSK